MKIKIVILSILQGIVPLIAQQAGTTQQSSLLPTTQPLLTQESPQTAVNTTQLIHTVMPDISSALFDPVTTTSPSQPDPYPTTSINTASINALFGTGGLNVDPLFMRHIQNCYF